MVNDNFGDVIQAKVWVDFYQSKGLKVVFIYLEAGKEVIQENLPNVELLLFSDFINKLNNSEIESSTIVHMYGGGYLNSNFGDDFIRFFKAFSHLKNNLFITGIQVDKHFHDLLKEIYPTNPENIKWISFRDSISRNLLNLPNALICDDSFGYFKDRIGNRTTYNQNTPEHENMLLQLSLNNYMYRSETDREEARQKLKEFINEHQRKNSKLIIVSSFDKNADRVIEATNLIKELEITPEPDLESAMLINNKESDKVGYSLAITNSFHTYILCKFKLTCPVYMISMSDYYDQKVGGLKEYGLIDDQHLITSLDQLATIDLNEKNSPYLEKEFEQMFANFRKSEQIISNLI